MVNLHLVAISLSAALSGIAIASDCSHGYYYCGFNLLRKGNYYEDIAKSLTDAGQTIDDAHVLQSLFFCKGDDDVPCRDEARAEKDEAKRVVHAKIYRRNSVDSSEQQLYIVENAKIDGFPGIQSVAELQRRETKQ
ncbi:hypothetical protein NUW58_g5529 [Xylaria curta]|uniref:Uncharacterized protein n=1 Tax=Xylaria curta TaxID=42375 RepID=A0ACC1P2F6_9PEZI|nr:hypothetical protein NUW58_g5529 [Xylaria curta]